MNLYKLCAIKGLEKTLIAILIIVQVVVLIQVPINFTGYLKKDYCLNH